MLKRQIEEMFAVALILMAGFMSLVVLYMMLEYETEPLGKAIQVVVIIALGLIIMGEGFRLIRERKMRKKEGEKR